MTNLITGLIGIALVIGFVSFMLIWVPAPPLIIIVVGVMAMLIYRFRAVGTIRRQRRFVSGPGGLPSRRSVRGPHFVRGRKESLCR